MVKNTFGLHKRIVTKGMFGMFICPSHLPCSDSFQSSTGRNTCGRIQPSRCAHELDSSVVMEFHFWEPRWTERLGPWIPDPKKAPFRCWIEMSGNAALHRTFISQLTVVFSRHFSRWWCCSSKISSSLKSSESKPFCSCRNIRLSANFFLLANAAEELAFATRILANRAFRWAFLLSARWFWW